MNKVKTWFKQLWCALHGHGETHSFKAYSNRTMTVICSKCDKTIELG